MAKTSILDTSSLSLLPFFSCQLSLDHFVFFQQCFCPIAQGTAPLHPCQSCPAPSRPAAGRPRHTVHTHWALVQENLSTKHLQPQQSVPTTSTQQVLKVFKPSALLILTWLKDRAKCVDQLHCSKAGSEGAQLSSAPTSDRREGLHQNTF